MNKSWEEIKKELDYQAQLRGISRKAKENAYKSAMVRRKGRVLLSLEKAVNLFNVGKLFWDYNEEHNKRKTQCKVCGVYLNRGEGIRLCIYADDFFHLSFYFICEECIKKINNNCIDEE